MDRAKVDRLEREIQKLLQVDCPVRHHFAPGIYAREMTIPAGVVLTGAVHRHEHLCTVAKGRILVSTDEGMKELSAGYTFVSKAGAKRVGYALEETVFTTYHVTNETDLDKLMIEITESTNAELLGGADNVQLKMNRLAHDRADYDSFLVEYGLSQSLVTKLVENESDRVPMPESIDTIALGDSEIHGKGMFSTRDIAAGECIAPARIEGCRTPAGRFINHSARPNAEFRALANGDLVVDALEAIKSGTEITICYRQAMRVNGAGFTPIKEQS
jgi:quercetin dioxygenase-like cupin family protein